MTDAVKIVVYVPLSHADALRKAMGDAGAGVIGDYTYCSFSSRGIGRYKAGENSNPTIGKPGEFSEVEEERIETVVSREKLQAVIDAIKSTHPYEEPAFDIFPVEVV